jgi:hypothetical protein
VAGPVPEIRTWFDLPGPADEARRSSRAVTARSVCAASKAKNAGRNVDLELWQSSGWPQPQNTHVVSKAAWWLASQLGAPLFQVGTGVNLRVQYPRCERTDAFLEAFGRACETDQQILLELFRGSYSKDEPSWLDSATIGSLSPEQQAKLTEYVVREEVHGPWRLLRDVPFPIEDYLLQLFQTERLTAYANLPDTPVARTLTKADWGGLYIAAGGEWQRLCIWRIGHRPDIGNGDFENVRVERDAVLRAFPEEPPDVQLRSNRQASDDEARALIRAATRESNGFVSQEKGAEIVRSKFRSFPKKHAMQLVRELTGNEKPGPKGPRKNRAANRAE